ncbi:MAG: helix-turn-helix domain-containing protein [Bacteroidales bacterium]|nr:helix-turn-helix domain-containing protein [Bacteroidales bacterium]
MQLPIFPANTKLLSNTWGVFLEDDHVYYLHNGSPVHVHSKNDINTFRYVTASLIVNHACSGSRLSEIFGIARINFYRYAKRLREGGADAFFKPNDNRGKCHKLTPDKIEEAQEYLDLGHSQLKTAKTLNVSESAIRYHIRNGNLKKKKKAQQG